MHIVLIIAENGEGLQAKTDNGYQDDHDRDYGDNPSRTWALWVLEQQPHLSLKLIVGKRSLLLLDETLVFSEYLDGLVAQLVEANLLWENIKGDVDRPS